jgi:phospholipid N-methyltransferase
MPDATNGSGLREHVLLFSRFLRSPRTVGALSPSSRALARAIAGELDEGEGRRVIELGPGTGALTTEIIQRLRPDDRFLAVDIDPEFVRQLEHRWPAIEFVCGSAARLHEIAGARGMPAADHIISGLPFATLPVEMTREILASVGRTLRPGGKFTTFQYTHAYPLATSAAFRREMTALMGVRPSRHLVIRNLPPCFVITWRRVMSSQHERAAASEPAERSGASGAPRATP